MSRRPIRQVLEHKLKHDASWAHMLPTPFDHPAFSVPALPFRWVMREAAAELGASLGTGYVAEDEPREGWKDGSTWVLSPENQKRCLDVFWSAVMPRRSLCFFYVKAAPGIEDPRRVLIGAGLVESKGEQRPYIPGDPNGYGAWVWERPVQHSIRPEYNDGFVLPYQALIARADAGELIELESIAAFVPDEHREEFSFATEHVTPDTALAALEALASAIDKMRGYVADYPWETAVSWLNARITEVKTQRGAFPGLGSALMAIGLSQGARLAAHLTHDLPADVDVWERVAAVMANPNLLPDGLRSQITSTRRKYFDRLRTRPEQFTFLRLLSRFPFTQLQTRVLWDNQVRERAGIQGTVSEFLGNPYLLYERLRLPAELRTETTTEDGETEVEVEIIPPIAFRVVDRGVFLAAEYAKHHPLPGTPMEGADDPRRIRALVTYILADAEAREGHTILPIGIVAERATSLQLDPPCPVNTDIIELFEDDWEDAVRIQDLGPNDRVVQLESRGVISDDIRNLIRRARHGSLLAVTEDWAGLILEQLGGAPANERDQAARAEKANALQQIAVARFSVLVGPAGTGKTTLLKALCACPAIRERGVLMLAPTGKARVRLQTQTGMPAQTIAQFLVPLGRYQSSTGRYMSSVDRAKDSRWKTVIVDEASMLTEDQIAALLDGLSDVDRYVFVGDPSQLPPIGAGRPFVDLVNALRPPQAGTRVGPGFAELTIRMRQGGFDPSAQPDLRLAELFRSEAPARDEILQHLERNRETERVRYIEWTDAANLRECLTRALKEELKIEEMPDLCGTLGGVSKDGHWYFNQGAEREVEAWQILSPTRVHPGAGTEELNRVLQRMLRGDTLAYASGGMRLQFRIPKPAGPQQVVYGDKVINVKNRDHPYVYPRKGPDGDPLKYVANGEIGVIIGESLNASRPSPWIPAKLEVAFGSQPGFRYSFWASSLKDDAELPLELAYALTVHKAQGSEFPKVFLIVPRNASTLCRELIYTGLTRHKDKVIILGQGSPAQLARFAGADASATAKRLTNITANDPVLERRPSPVQVKDRRSGKIRLYDRALIHLTRAEILVRSKSEVIIADELDHAQERKALSYEYEEPLQFLQKEAPRFPDFTVRPAGSTRVYYWEHLGMLRNKAYKDAWDAKAAWYRSHGVSLWDGSNTAERQLIITSDGDNGEINAKDVADKVRAICSR